MPVPAPLRRHGIPGAHGDHPADGGNRILEIAPLAYMRGRTLRLLHQSGRGQNTTEQMKMFLTASARLKAVVTGDITRSTSCWQNSGRQSSPYWSDHEIASSSGRKTWSGILVRKIVRATRP
jgi:hypothetical protein